MTGGRLLPILTDERLRGPRLWIPEPVLSETERLLRSYGGAEDHEGIVYWGGIETPAGAVALTALSPTAATTWGSFRTEASANTDLVLTLACHELSLVAQVHSHPGDWVDHSDGDDAGALVRFEGFWSLVVPRFARAGLQPLHRVGIHLFEDGTFRRLGWEAVTARVRVLPIMVDLRGEER
jgi:hypothetical protein